MITVPTIQKESLNGTEIHYEFYQHSQPADTLVLLHGFLSSSFSFRKLIPFLTTRYNVISIDMPPFGQSGKTNSFVYSYERVAAAIIALVEKLGIKQCTLIGHSMGGQISLNIMKQRPDFVEQGILLCSSGYLPRLRNTLIYSSYIPFFHMIVKKWLAKSGIEKNLQNVVYDRSLIDDEMRNGYMEPFLNDDIFKALAKMIRDREGDLPEDDLQQIQTRCLLIWGEKDRVVPLATGKRLNKDLPNSKLIIIKNTGHLLPEEKPEEVFTYIQEFLQQS